MGADAAVTSVTKLDILSTSGGLHRGGTMNSLFDRGHRSRRTLLTATLLERPLQDIASVA